MSFLSRYENLGITLDLDARPKPALRINTLKIAPNALLTRLKRKGVSLERIPFANQGYWYHADFSLGATPEYLHGLYYLQEAASQVPPIVLDPNPGDVVLDMAAAPGSKTTQLAQLMDDQGVIVALDTEPIRLASLRNNIERMGISSVVCYKKDARFAADLGLAFDKVLLDAPCSGNYCIEENYFSEKTISGIKQRAKLQKELLKSAYKVLKSGGTLVYSTCSLEPEEDELVIAWFLQKYPDMSVRPIDLPVADPGLTDVFGESLDQSLSLTKRFWPQRSGTQGFFVAKLVKA